MSKERRYYMKYKILLLIWAFALIMTSCGQNPSENTSGSIDISQNSEETSSSESSAEKNENSQSSEEESSTAVQNSSSNSSVSSQTITSKPVVSSSVSSKVTTASSAAPTSSHGSQKHKENRPNLTLIPNEDVYGTDTEIINFKAVNDGRYDITLPKNFELQKFNESSGKWHSLTNQKNSKYSPLELKSKNVINSGSSTYLIADISDFLEPMHITHDIQGLYRIVIFANKNYSFCEFRIGEEQFLWDISEVCSSLTRNSYTPNVKKLEITITNNTDEELSYGSNYALEKYNFRSAKWEQYLEYESGAPAFTDEEYIIYPHETNNEVITLSGIYKSPFMHGKYRIVKKISDNYVTAEFTIDDTLGDFDKQFVDRFYNINEIAKSKVKFRKYDHTEPMSYDGIVSDSEKSGIDIRVYYMEDANQLNKQLKLISDDGYKFTIPMMIDGVLYPTNKVITYDWNETPHFFKTDTELIVYSGSNKNIISGLQKEFGKEIFFK